MTFVETLYMCERQKQTADDDDDDRPTSRRVQLVLSSDVVLETKVLVSRRLEDKNTSLGLGLDKKSFAFSSLFRPC